MSTTIASRETIEIEALARDLEVSSLTRWVASDVEHDDELDLRMPGVAGITAGCGCATGGNSSFSNTCI